MKYFVIDSDFPSIIAEKHPERATTAELYPGRDTFEFDQGHMTKNHPITVLVFLVQQSPLL